MPGTTNGCSMYIYDWSTLSVVVPSIRIIKIIFYLKYYLNNAFKIKLYSRHLLHEFNCCLLLSMFSVLKRMHRF